MNPHKYLVIIKGEDKTEEVNSYDNGKTCIYINYKNSTKKYPCSRKDFEFYKDPIEINLQEYKITMNQRSIQNIAKIIKFNGYYRIFFENNISIVVPENNIELLENSD